MPEPTHKNHRYDNPFNVEERDSHVMYSHLAWAESCLRQSMGMGDEYAAIVLRNKALEHIKSGMECVQPWWKDRFK